MSITINSNILSLNAQRRLGQHTNDLRSSFEKLSSGLRVSNASDDAAGLSISENLKTDSRLSSQALRNVNDGISMISIISGALDSQKSILFRMAELAEQSANGVNSSKQRGALQKEFMSLQEEFDRVASSAKFNGISLLRNTDANTVSLMTGITGADSSLISVAAANSHRFAGTFASTSQLIGPLNPPLWSNIFSIEFTDPEYAVGSDNKLDVQDYGSFRATNSLGEEVIIKASFWLSDYGSLAGGFAKVFEEGSDVSTYTSQNLISIDSDKILRFNFTHNTSGATVALQLDLSDFVPTDIFTDANKIGKSSVIGFTNIDGQRSSKEGLVVIKNRIEELSGLQGKFGALESRLNVAANNLQINRENYQSAASQITDIDVATESANLVKTQILQQAAVSVLAQANQQPQIALKLLGELRL